MNQTDGRLARLLDRYPVLARLPAAERAALAGSLQWLSLPAHAVVFDERQDCPGFPFILDGAIRVVKCSPNGRQITLYRVEPGDSCIITTSCLLATSAYNARGETDGAVELALAPAAAFARLQLDEGFRRFVFSLFGQRIAVLMQLIEDVAFNRLDQRLAALLLQRGPVLHATHQALADELGSVREIVTRLLRDFAERGWVGLQRERIEVTDSASLGRRAQGQVPV